MFKLPRLWPLPNRQDDIFKLLGVIMTALTDLQTQVAATVTAEQAAIAAIAAIAEQLTAALANQANPDSALVDLTTQLTNSAAALSAAVTAHTAPVVAPAA